MLESLSLSSITMTATHLWNSATTLLRQKPVPLYEKALHESGYQAYLNFKEHVKYYPKRGFGEIISPYVLLASKNIPGLQKAHLVRFLQNHPGKALGFFYNDLINHLVDLSASSSNGDAPDFQAFEAMLSFYESFVPEETYHEVLNHYKTLDRSDLQQSILEVTRKINLSFRQMQLSSNRSHYTPGFMKLVLMGTISVLSSRNLGLPLGLGALSMLATPVRGAYPTVASPIPPQGTQPGELFSYEFDMNQVFTDSDGDVLSLADFEPSDGSSLPAWIAAQPKKVFGKDYPRGAATAFNGNPGVWVSKDIAYVAHGGYGCTLTTHDVKNPNNTEFLGCLRSPSIMNIILRYPYLYTAHYDIGVIDISEPRWPTLIRTVDPRASLIYEIASSSKFLFVKTGYPFATQIFSLQLPANPVYLSSLPLFDAMIGTDSYLYTMNNTGFFVYDLSNPISPQLVGNCNAPGNVVAMQGNFVHVLKNNDKYRIVDIRNPNFPNIVGNISVGGVVFQ